MLIIGITGTSGAGKGTVVDYLIKKKKFKHFSVGDYLKKEAVKRKLEINRPNLQDIGNELRTKFGPDYITQKLFEEAKSKNKNAIIESIRNPKEAEFIKSKGGIMFAVTADQKIRYERIKLRLSEKDNVTLKEFQRQEKKEFQNTDPNAQNLPKCIEMSDYLFNNGGTLKDLYKKIEDTLKQMKNKKAKVEKYIRPSWDEYFLEIMRSVSKRATCDRGRASAVFVKDKQILVTGYVGSPVGMPHCDEVGHQLMKTIHEDGSISEHCVRTVHAEQNAICQAAKRGVSIDKSTVYVNMTPCRVCAMLLINSGVARVVAANKYHAGEESEMMFKKAKVKLEFISNEVVTYSKAVAQKK